MQNPSSFVKLGLKIVSNYPSPLSLSISNKVEMEPSNLDLEK